MCRWRQHGGGPTNPILSRAELYELGFKFAIFPASGFLAMGQESRGLEARYGMIAASFSWHSVSRSSSFRSLDSCGEIVHISGT